MNDILPLLEGISQQSRSLLIIADDVEAEILGTLVVNKLRGLLSTVCVKAPAFGDRKKQILEEKRFKKRWNEKTCTFQVKLHWARKWIATWMNTKQGPARRNESIYQYTSLASLRK